MDNRSLNTRQDPVTQASEFFVEFRAGDGTPAVRARFEKWLRSSPENVQAYLEIAAGWSDLPAGDPEDRIDLQALLAAAHDAQNNNVVHLESSHARVPHPSAPHRMPRWLFAGSLALLLVVLSVTSFWVVTRGGTAYTTGVGEQRTLILSDGSTVTLNALTTVVVQMTPAAREVTLLRGQAYFHDTDEPARPFIVRAGKTSARAVGTEFDVDEESDRTVVTVLAGQVVVAKSFAWIDSIKRRDLLHQLSSPDNRLNGVLVSAGEQVTVQTQAIPAPNSVDLTAVTAWMQRRLVFDATPLWEVAEQFNLYSKRRLVIADPSLRSIGVSGEYSASDPAALIGFLRSQPTLHVIEKEDKFLVTRP